MPGVQAMFELDLLVNTILGVEFAVDVSILVSPRATESQFDFLDIG